MKVRLDFVTNSSSSSYLVVYKIFDSPEFRDYIRDEYGKHGVKLFESEIHTWEDLNEWDKDEIASQLIEDYYDIDDDERESAITNYLSKDDKFVSGDIVTYTTEGDQSSEIILVVQDLPDKFKELIYEGEDS